MSGTLIGIRLLRGWSGHRTLEGSALFSTSMKSHQVQGRLPFSGVRREKEAMATEGIKKKREAFDAFSVATKTRAGKTVQLSSAHSILLIWCWGKLGMDLKPEDYNDKASHGNWQTCFLKTKGPYPCLQNKKAEIGLHACLWGSTRFEEADLPNHCWLPFSSLDLKIYKQLFPQYISKQPHFMPPFSLLKYKLGCDQQLA